MSKYTTLGEDLHAYVVRNGARQDELLARVQRETEALGSVASMQISPDQGALMTMLTRLIGAREALEVGTFTGYSAISIGRGLAPGGRLVCCELDPGYAEVAAANIAAAGLDDVVEIRVGPAAETLRAMPAEPRFDLAFIDADKESYAEYYELALERVRPGGIVMLDNVLRGGRVLDPPPGDTATQAIHELNERLAVDERIELAIVPIADGLTIARKL